MNDDWSWDKFRLNAARNIREILRLCHNLRVQAWNDHSAEEYPGGDAMLMLGPVATLTTWQAKVDAAEQAYFDAIDEGRPAVWPEVADYDTDPAPPLLVLGDWEDRIRDARNQPTYMRATIDHAGRYLLDSIDWMAAEEWLPADQFAADIRALRYRLEAVLRDGKRPTFGVPCLHCRQPLLRLEDDRRGLLDEYRCTNAECGKVYKKSNYDYTVGVTYLHNSPELTAAQIQERLGISAGRVRVWGVRYEGIRTGRRDSNGLLLYDVEAVMAKRDEIESERKAKSA